MVTHDDYGNVLHEAFDRELDYFVNNVFCREIPPHVWNYLWDGPPSQSPISMLGDLLKRFATISPRRAEVQETFNSAMSAFDFELFCSQLLNMAGWASRVTAASGDQGIDIIAAAGRAILVVQCKLYSTPVGNSAVQEIIAGRAFEHETKQRHRQAT